jgi:hypothetical protein
MRFEGFRDGWWLRRHGGKRRVVVYNEQIEWYRLMPGKPRGDALERGNRGNVTRDAGSGGGGGEREGK